MIVSASYKTDIPTFYGQWFMNRLRAGYCKMINPYNRQVLSVSLRRPECDGFVFWTKNIVPFMPHLHEVRQMGYPFVVQHAVNGYPRVLEYAVVDAEKSIAHMRRIAEEFGPRVGVWRYDTIVISSETPVEFHLRNFESIAGKLAGSVDEVVISFMQVYRKTLRNLNEAASECGLTWQDPAIDEKRKLVAVLAQMAAAHGIQLTVCSQRDLLVPGAQDARCIDADRLAEVAGQPISAPLKGNRKECGCFACRDIGEYDTCPHGCVYCYAVQNRALAQRRYQAHDPESEFLLAPARETGSSTESTFSL